MHGEHLDFLIQLLRDLLIVLIAGTLAGAICRRLNVSLIVGYLIVGAAIGTGGFAWVSGVHQVEFLAQAGALLLLFSIGIELSADELKRMARFLFVGGPVQMLLVSVPVILFCWYAGIGKRAAILFGAALAFSSTVLVFKALAEWGQSNTPHGRRAISILLFQDLMLVPLVMLVPLLTGTGEQATTADYVKLAAVSIIFTVVVIAARWFNAVAVVPVLAKLRSAELLVLYSLSLLVGACMSAYWIALPPVIGAFAAGFVLSGNRLSKQIDALVLPYRETFAAIFFVSLGMFFEPKIFLEEPFFLAACLIAIMALKATGGALALRLTGLPWKASWGMGIGLAQLGEFAFILISEGLRSEPPLVRMDNYNRVLFLAIGTLIATPPLIRLGLRWSRADREIDGEDSPSRLPSDLPPAALVIGLGPIGRTAASQLEIQGTDVHLIDYSPVNIYPYEQQGFHATSGDAREPSVLRRAEVERCNLVIVAVPADAVAIEVVRTIRELNAAAKIIVRCRFQQTAAALKRSGADVIISEEGEAANALQRILIDSAS